MPTRRTLTTLAVYALMLLAIRNPQSTLRNPLAQSAAAILSGTVVDEAGAAVAGAKIELTNLGTVLKRAATTSGEGHFTFPLLPPGNYTLQTLREGFAPVEVRNIVLNVNDQQAIKIQMKVGQVGATVNVVDSASLTPESPAVSTVIDRQFVANQPLNGRSFQTLIGLAPGVVFTPTNVTTQGQFSVNGQRSGANYFTVDGVSANFGTTVSQTLYETAGGGLPSLSLQGGTNALVSVDALQEFSIQTSTYAPEFGRQPGAQVSIVTRSGTNELHGSLFEYLRNDVFDANDYFSNLNGFAKPALRQNDFGFTAGGPVFLPKFRDGKSRFLDGRNRTFFFVSYEGLRLRQPVVTDPVEVPSLSARQNATGLARNILNAFPLPTRLALTSDPNTATFVSSYSIPSSLNATSFRVDHKVRDGLTLFGRFNDAPSNSSERAVFSAPNVVQTTLAQTLTVTGGATMIFSPRVINEMRLNFSRAKVDVTSETDRFGGGVVLPDSAYIPSFASREDALGSINIGSGNSIIQVGPLTQNQQRQINLIDSMTFTAGSHSLKFGFDYRRLFPINANPPYFRGLFFDDVAQIISGQVGLLFAANFGPTLYPIYNNYSAFAQDTWQASRRLMLIYGVRYDVNPAPSEKNGVLNFTVRGVDNPANLTLTPQGTRFYDTTYTNFAPRVGAAYQLFPKRGTTLRGGFGVFYDLGYTFTGSAFNPFNSLTDTNVPLSSPELQTQLPPLTRLTPPYGTLTAFAPGYKLPYTLQYNVALEQMIGANSLLSVAYVGAAGRRLGRVEFLNNPNPDFTGIRLVTNTATSDYNSLQVQFRRRLSNGLQVVSSYAFAKSLDIVSDESIINIQPPVRVLDPRQDRGPSSFDVRHVFSAAVSYDIPPLFAAGLGRAVFSGFSIDSIFRARSATPVNVVTGDDPFVFGIFNPVIRPDLVPGQALYVKDSGVAGGRRINSDAFIAPPAGRQGALGKNSLRGFPLSQWDLSLRRQFNLSERLRLQFKIDAFNFLNHPNFADPTGVLTDPNFGVSTKMYGRGLASSGSGLSPLYQVGGPRSLQFALKFSF
jgi:hypothetical protein